MKIGLNKKRMVIVILRTIQKCSLFSLERIWFLDKDETGSLESKCDICRLMRVKDVPKIKGKVLVDKAYTLISNLIKSADELLAEMDKTVRYEIKRCMNKDDVMIDHYLADDLIIKADVIDDFQLVYNTFCDISNQQALKKDFNRNKIERYVKNQCIVISSASFKNGKVYHMYVYDENSALLVYSASDFRNPEVSCQLAGRVNKMLHFMDMIYFKENGNSVFDWGNVSSFNKPNGIDIFKSKFGGTEEERYNIYYGVSLFGKLLVTAMKIRRRIGNLKFPV